MFNTIRFSAVLAVLVLALSGCQSHQAKVDALQREYDRVNQQYAKDCSAEYLKVPPTLSPKCEAESKDLKSAWDRLQAERAKQ